MTDTADQTAPAARDDQPQAPGETPEGLLAESLEMPAPGPAPAGFRFPIDAELMGGPNLLADPDDEEDGEDEPDDDSDGADDSARVEIVVPDFPEDFRAGFAYIVGRPNAGESTLTNAMVGAKIVITSRRPQTTRHNVRDVIHKENVQVVLVDTPGLHRPRTLPGKRLNDLMRETLADVDVVVFCIPANEKIGPGDRFITRDLAELRIPMIAVVTKADTVTREALAAQLLAVSELGEWAGIVPVSVQRNKQIDVLEEVLLKYMPLSPPLYPTGETTDEPQQIMITELVYEAALEGVRDGLPHSLAVVVDEIADPDDEREVGRIKGAGGCLRVRVSFVIERDSQKAIIIGRGGWRLKEVSVTTRKGIEQLLGRRVYPDLHIRTAKDRQSDPKAPVRLGF